MPPRNSAGHNSTCSDCPNKKPEAENVVLGLWLMGRMTVVTFSVREGSSGGQSGVFRKDFFGGDQ